MSDINQLIITGNLTRDAEQRFTSNGKAVVSFTVANNRGFGDNKKTHFFNCSIWGKRAEGRLVTHLTKGNAVVVTGEVSMDVREHNGKTYANMNVFVNELKLGGGGQSRESDSPSNNEDFDDGFGDSIPF